MSPLTLVCATAILLLATPAAAQPSPSTPVANRAVALSDEGIAAFRQQRYDEAIAAFAASYALAPLPALSFDIAQAYRLKGDCANASELYRRYLREAPDAPNREFAAQQLRTMEACAKTAATPPAVTAAPEVPPAPPAKPTLNLALTAAPAASSPARAKPLVKQPWFWITIGGATALVAVGVSVGAVYGAPTYPTSTVVVRGN
jgi:tetratricopeptide (TPR) repeat protein